MSNEHLIQNSILEYLAFNNKVAWFDRINSGKWMTCIKTKNGIKLTGFVHGARKGTSDIIGMLKNGKMIAIEVKNSKGKLKKEQLNFLEKISNNGGYSIVARNVEDVSNFLDNYVSL